MERRTVFFRKFASQIFGEKRTRAPLLNKLTLRANFSTRVRVPGRGFHPLHGPPPVAPDASN